MFSVLFCFVLARWPFATSSSSLGARAAIHAASQVDHEKRVAWFSISMHAFGSVAIVTGHRLAALWVAEAPLISLNLSLYGFSCFQHITLEAFRVKNV